MPLNTLRQGILYAMKENLNVQFVYPDYPLHKEYEETIDGIDHTDIKPSACAERTDVVVTDACQDFDEKDGVVVLRTDRHDFFENIPSICTILDKVSRLNIVITDVASFTDEDFEKYKRALAELGKEVEQLYVDGKPVQLNLLTDRMFLEKMNNCGAGDTTVTLAPDGRFYVCPAFYQDEDGYAIGDIASGLDIKNAQLYRIDHAPLCRHCDAFQCKRSVWFNRNTTLEVNTPSHEQCVVAHLERNASRELLASIRKHGEFIPETEINEIDFLDPFELRKEW